MTLRVVKTMWAPIVECETLPNGVEITKARHYPKGSVIDVDEANEARLDALGALESTITIHVDPVVTDAPTHEPHDGEWSDPELIELCAESKVSELVELVGEDAVLAKRVLVAESQAHDGDPRKGVVKALTLLVEGA